MTSPRTPRSEVVVAARIEPVIARLAERHDPQLQPPPLQPPQPRPPGNLLRDEPTLAIAVAGDAPAQPSRSTRTDRLLVVSAVALAAWSLAYAALHLYFALGGTIGLSTVKPSASAATEWRTANWAATVVLVLPAMIAVTLIRVRAGRLKAAMMLASLGGAAIAAGHGLYGIVYRALMVAGPIDVEGRPFDLSQHGWVLWDLLAYEPWFLIEGLLFAIVGWAASAPNARRRWTIACASGIAVAIVTGLAGLRF